MAAGLSFIGAQIFMSSDRDGPIIAYLHSVLPGLIILGINNYLWILILSLINNFNIRSCICDVLNWDHRGMWFI